MLDKEIRVGVVGAGNSAVESHIPRFQSIDGVEVVSVANRTPESSQRVADRLGIPTVYDYWPDLIDAADTNAIFIGTWPYLHKPMTIAALEAGKHVLCQSRMAMDAQEAHDMLEASLERPNLVTGLVPTSKLAAGRPQIMQLLSDGWFGELLAIDLVSGSDFIDRDSQFFWRQDRDVSGFNAVEVGMFGESLASVLGPFASVMSLTRLNVPQRKDSTGKRRIVTMPDHVEIIGEMVNGAPYHLRTSQVTGLADNGLWLFGSEGTLRADTYAAQLYGAKKGDTELREIPTSVSKDPVDDIAAEFVNAIREERPIEQVSFADGVKYMEFTEAVSRSAQTGETVHLPL
jgi:predicted dehydrogenase